MKMEDNEMSEREKEAKEFLQSKSDVKGLVDSGITKVPRIFIHSLPQQYGSSTPSLQEMKEYYKALVGIRKILGELLSEALGLSSDYITNAGCLNSMSLFCHYHPVPSEPHLTMGSTKHADSSFLTILLQDTTGGLQVLHQNHWIDVKPVREAFLVNIVDLMQILINKDKMKRVEHRVLATQEVKARVSVACFFNSDDKLKPYGPIKELLSESNPPLYKDTNYIEYATHYQGDGFYTTSLPHFKLA